MPDGIYIVDSWDHWKLRGSKSAVPFQFSAMHAEPGIVRNNNNTDTYTLLVFLIRTKRMIRNSNKTTTQKLPAETAAIVKNK